MRSAQPHPTLHFPMRLPLLAILVGGLSLPMAEPLQAQSVCLPAPRLLTTMPMGGQAGSQVEVSITGQDLDDARELVFSDARLSATPKLNDAGTSLLLAHRDGQKDILELTADNAAPAAPKTDAPGIANNSR